MGEATQEQVEEQIVFLGNHWMEGKMTDEEYAIAMSCLISIDEQGELWVNLLSEVRWLRLENKRLLKENDDLANFLKPLSDTWSSPEDDVDWTKHVPFDIGALHTVSAEIDITEFYKGKPTWIAEQSSD